ncbi:MAG: metallophosphoesterase [unclassified Hahellaceae]|nr:metallophosphoesterase [Hahellaceae bacterium]|tara:strand:- start:8490 stop:9125 length:636 start_codon:yes stop_codon:yes gene_type:complete
MKIVCVSDTHSRHELVAVPDGDVLIHAGDCTGRGSEEDLVALDRWFSRQPHRHKILIAGNHDRLFESEPARARELITAATYLEDSGTVIDGLNFWGSPWTPTFFDWHFMRERGAPMAEVWECIPASTDVLITHGPPMGVLDEVPRGPNEVEHTGCADLMAAVLRVRPKIHIFGHIHEGYGTSEIDGTLFINASSLDERYRPVNPPIVFEIS